MSNQPVHIISDTESESESDGGMQLDDLDRADGIPMFDTSENGGLPNLDGIPMPRSQSDNEIWGLNTSNGSDTGMCPPLVLKSNYELSTIHLYLHLNRVNPCFCALHQYTAQILPQQPQVYKTNTPKKGRFNARAQNPLTTSYNRASPNSITEPQTAFEKDARTRSHLRDEKHAALAVLMDSELLVTYALASREVR
jgi:hypothetical protein